MRFLILYVRGDCARIERLRVETNVEQNDKRGSSKGEVFVPFESWQFKSISNIVDKQRTDCELFLFKYLASMLSRSLGLVISLVLAFAWPYRSRTWLKVCRWVKREYKKKKRKKGKQGRERDVHAYICMQIRKGGVANVRARNLTNTGAPFGEDKVYPAECN